MGRLKEDTLSPKLNELYISSKPKFIAYVQNNSPFDKETAEDLFHDSFTALYNNLREGKYVEYGKLESYFWRIGHNKLVDLLNAHGREEDNLRSLSLKWAEDILGEDELEEALAVVSGLLHEIENENCGKILRWFYWDRKKLAEIAQLAGYKSEQALKNRKRMCMETIGGIVKERLNKLGIDLFKQRNKHG